MIFFQAAPEDSAAFFFFEPPLDFFGRLRTGAGAGSSS
jgi:hypothetical protein